jgi:hypothetical protein
MFPLFQDCLFRFPRAYGLIVRYRFPRAYGLIVRYAESPLR